MKRYKEKAYLLLITSIIVVGLMYIAFVFITFRDIAHAVPAIPFDHSNCQYPNRLSNPPNGCDNSDPARPECMKYGTEDCDIPYPEPLEIVDTPITPSEAPSEAPVENKTLVCEYK
jgi:hypothetical protein